MGKSKLKTVLKFMGDHKSSHAQELQAMFCVFHSLQNQSLEPPYTF